MQTAFYEEKRLLGDSKLPNGKMFLRHKESKTKDYTLDTLSQIPYFNVFGEGKRK